MRTFVDLVKSARFRALFRSIFRSFIQILNVFSRHIASIIAIASMLVAISAIMETRYEQRAWIPAPGIRSFYLPDHKHVGFQYTIKNVGKYPPLGMYIGAKLVSVDGGKQWVSAADAKCDEGFAEARDRKSDFYLFSVVPEAPFVISDALNNHPTNAAINTIFDPTEAPPNLHIAGCIVYKVDDGFLGLFGRTRRTKFVAPLAIQGAYVGSPTATTSGPT